MTVKAEINVVNEKKEFEEAFGKAEVFEELGYTEKEAMKKKLISQLTKKQLQRQVLSVEYYVEDLQGNEISYKQIKDKDEERFK